MPENDLLALVRAGLNPQQVAALQGIANMRQAGFQDSETFAMPSSQVQGYAGGQAPLRLGAGSAYLPTAANLAQTTAQYRLGRGDLAQRSAEFGHTRAVDEAAMGARPFNTIQYLDYLARTGAALPLGNATLDRLRPITPVRAPTAPEQYVEDFLAYPREEAGDIGVLRGARAGVGNDAEFMKGMEAIAAFDKGKLAGGGEVVSDEPMVGMGMLSGRPRFLLGEERPEKLEVTPMAAGGTVKVNSRFNTRSKMARLGEDFATPAQKDAYGARKAASDSGAVGRTQQRLPLANVVAPTAYAPTPGSPALEQRRGLAAGTATTPAQLGTRKPAPAAGEERAPSAQPSPGVEASPSPGSGDSVETSAKLIGQSLKSTNAQVPPEFIDQLLRGVIPGISGINARQIRTLDTAVRKSLYDLWMASGLASDEEGIEHAVNAYRVGA